MGAYAVGKMEDEDRPSTRLGGPIVVRAVFSSILLVVATALAVAAALVMALGSQIAGQLHDLLILAMPITLVIILIGAALSYFFMRRVLKPISVLVDAARQLSRGDLTTPVPQFHDGPMAPLAQQLERARGSIRATMAAIAEEEARQRALFDALHDPVLTGESGGVTGFNAAAVALFGKRVGQRHATIADLLPLVQDAASSEGKAMSWHGRVVDASGATRDVEVTRTRLSRSHLPPNDVYVVRDVTKHAELSRLREELLYSVSHELRSPLSTLDNALDILATDHSSLSAAELDDLVGSARRTARRLRRLMEDLLSAGSIQSGRFTVHPVAADISEILDEAIEDVAPLIERRGQRVESEIHTAAARVYADRRYAAQLLANLLSNAIKYSPSGESIQIEAIRADRWVRVTIADRGPGIPPDQREGLFERFYRSRQQGDKPGIGLGLAIAKGIVEAHGGAIGIDSTGTHGTRVWFTLPAQDTSI